jgi:hypothetical protein
LQIGLALTLVGVFAAIYHPIGNAMLSAIDPGTDTPNGDLELVENEGFDDA